MVCLLLLFAFGVCFLADKLVTLTGFLMDPQGFLVPGAKIQVTNLETRVSYFSETNDEGLYRVPGIPIGTYHIVVRKTGFETAVKPDIELHVQDAITEDIQLELGSMSESVTVDEGVFMIHTTPGVVSWVMDTTYVENMPPNGHGFQGLLLLFPGIVTNRSQHLVGHTSEFSVNGQRTESNSYAVDGVSANVGPVTGPSNFATGVGTTQALVSVDALEEFRAQSSTYSAEYGRNPGGQFAFETKSGTSQWHGTTYHFERSDFLDAAGDSCLLNPTQTTPAAQQNDFGGTLGGPFRVLNRNNGEGEPLYFAAFEGLPLAKSHDSLTHTKNKIVIAEILTPKIPNAQVSTTIDGNFNKNIPFNGHSFQTSNTLTSSVVLIKSDNLDINVTVFHRDPSFLPLISLKTDSKKKADAISSRSAFSV
jgi:hypothetical protein